MEDLCREAETLLTTGSPHAALSAAETALAQNPASRQARRIRALALLDLRETEKALTELVTLAEDLASEPAEWYDVLTLAQAEGRRDLVDASVEALVSRNEISPDALLDAADAAYLDSDIDAARRYVRQAAVAIAEKGEDDGEVNAWGAHLDAIATGGDQRAVVLGTVEALLRHDRPEDALAQLTSLQGDIRSPDDQEIATLAGRSLLRLGRLVEAVAMLSQANAAQPNDSDLALELATAVHLIGDHARALELCEEVLARDGSIITARVLACESSVGLGQIDRAQNHAREALILAPDDPGIWHAWSGVLAASGDADTARVAADHAIVLDPSFVAAWQRGAEILDSLAQPELATRYKAEAILQGGPGPIVDRRDLPSVSSAEIDDARRWVSMPDKDYVGRDRFQIALALGLNELAASYANWLTDVEPDPHGDLAAVRGFLLIESGDLPAAEASFRTAIAKDPEHQRATTGLAIIKRLTAPPLPERPPPTAPTQAVATAAAAASAMNTVPDTKTSSSPATPPRPQNEVSLAKRLAVWASLLLGIATSIFVLVTLLSGDDRTATPQPAPTTIAVASTVATTPTTVVPTTVAPTTSGPPTPTTVADPFAPQFFASPEEALTDWLSLVEPPYAGTCEALAGQEANLGGTVTCSIYDHNVGLAEVYRWGVFATDDHRGWILVDVGSAGWSVADESFETTSPW